MGWYKTVSIQSSLSSMQCTNEFLGCICSFWGYFLFFHKVTVLIPKKVNSGRHIFMTPRPMYGLKVTNWWTISLNGLPPTGETRIYILLSEDSILCLSRYHCLQTKSEIPSSQFLSLIFPELYNCFKKLKWFGFRGKKLAAWLVSQCGVFEDAKARQLLVQTLQRFVPIDVFGRCSGRECPQTRTLSCRAYLGKNYKFYLAFENCLCQDYVTEKFFHSFEYNMVPVVFGGANYSLYAPPGSYINALDYDSVEDLAKHLTYLDQNDDEYLKYFSWRGQFTMQVFYTNDHLCMICQKIHEYLNPNMTVVAGAEFRSKSTYPSFRKWHHSFPVGSAQSAPFHVGRRIYFNSAKICVKYDEHPELHRWLLGEE